MSTRASGLCGRRIGPLHPQSTTAAAKNRNPPKAESFVVRRVILERSLAMLNLPNQFLWFQHHAARAIGSTEFAAVATKSDDTFAAGALSKLAESSGKAGYGQGGSIKEIATDLADCDR
jgi:hypothetical protein